jgi:uncharacterized membrane protein
MSDTSTGSTRPVVRKYEVSRLEALSDGVFAFALTLLVVSLEMPKSFEELRGNVKGFVAFGICFGMLVQIWWEHNLFFRRFAMEDAVTVFLNSILLFVVLFFVYPLKFLFTSFVEVFFGIEGNVKWHPNDLASMFIIYGFGYMAVFLAMMLLYWRALAKSAGLGLTELDRFDARAVIARHSIHVFLGSLCAVLAIFGVGLRYGIPGWIFGLSAPLFALNGYITGRRREGIEQKFKSSSETRP